MAGHDKTWLVANGDDGNKYWAFCRKYSDGYETAFKAQVRLRAGGCRRVHWENSEPQDGTQIVV